MNWCFIFLLLTPLLSFSRDQIQLSSTLTESSLPTQILYDNKQLIRFTEEDEKFRLNESFSLWFLCHSAKTARQELPKECVCELPATSTFVIPDYMSALTTCEPNLIDRGIAYSSKLSDQQKALRDDGICKCINSGSTIDSILETAPTQRDVKQLGSQLLSVFRRANLNPRREIEFQQTYGSSLSIANLSTTSEGKTRMIGVYTGDKAQHGKPEVTGGVSTEEVLRRHLDPSLFTDNQCVPYTDFILHKQFSLDPNFYATFPSTFQESDWDYRSLLKSLGSASNVDEVMADRNKSAIIARMRFLNDNPIYKNLFSSSRGDKNKERLFNLLKTKYPKPACIDIFCSRDKNFYQQMTDFRNEVTSLFSDPAVMKSVHRGISVTSKLADQSIEAEELVSSTKAFSDHLKDLPASSQKWKAFCRLRDEKSNKTVDEKQLNLALLPGIEKKFGRSFVNPSEDEEYARVNEQYCLQPRKSEDGKSKMLFADFKKTKCEALDHRACLKTFITAYPYAEKFKYLDTAINEIFIKDGFTNPVLDGSQFQRAMAIGSNRELRETSIRELATGNYKSTDTSTPAASTALAGAPPAQSTPRPSTTPTLEPFQNSELAGFAGPISEASVAPAKPEEVVREQLKHTDSDAQEIKNEISELRDSLEREGVKPENPEQSSLIRSLNERMLALEKKLATKEEEKRNLEEQLAQATKPASEGNRNVSGNGPETRGSFTQAQKAEGSLSQAGAVSNLPAAGLPSANTNTASSSRLTNELRNTKASSSVQSSSSLMRSKYANNGDQGNAITVSSSGADPQSAPVSISVPFSSDEFKSLSESALEKYFSGTDKPFVRVSLQDGEAFLVRNGKSIEVIPLEEGVRRGIASVGIPEPEKEFERSARREDLERLVAPLNSAD